MTDVTPASNEPEPDPPERAPADDIALLHEAIRLAIALVLERGEDRATANDVGLRAGTKFWEARAAGVYDPAQPLGPYMATIVRAYRKA